MTENQHAQTPPGQRGLEQAEAAREKWKAVQKGLELTERTAKFLGNAFGPAIEAAGGLLGDQLRYWRAINLDRLAGKWNEHLKARGIDAVATRPIPFGEAYRALDAASMEEDDNVQDLWARLLASAMDPYRPVTIKKVYVDLLKSIGPAEAAFLDLVSFLDTDLRRLTFAEAGKVRIRFEEHAARRWDQFSVHDQKTAIQNLIRLRCVVYNPEAPRFMRLFREVRSSRESRIEIDPRAFEDLFKYLEDFLLVATGLRDGKVGQEEEKLRQARGFGQTLDLRSRHPELQFVLTPMGRDLMRACNPKGDQLPE